MKVQRVLQISGAVIFSLVMASCALPEGGGLRPTERQFSSQWIDIMMGGVMAFQGEGLALGLGLKNKTKQPMYVLVAFVTPDPAQRCEIAKQLDVSQSELFRCPQTSVTANKDYPIEIEIFTDEARTTLIERTKTKFWFSEEDAKGIEELRKKVERVMSPPTLPAAFKGSYVVRQPGMGTRLMDPLVRPFADDTLVVRQELIEYTSRGKAFAISVSQVRSVEIKKYNGAPIDAWVEVEYMEPDGSKVVAFQGTSNQAKALMDILQEIERALRYVVLKRHKGTQDR